MTKRPYIVAELGSKHKVVSDSLNELYRSIGLLLDEWEQEENFKMAGSGMGRGSIDFSLVTDSPNDLPEKVVNLFLNNIDTKYKVTIKENDLYKKNKERHWDISIWDNKK